MKFERFYALSASALALGACSGGGNSPPVTSTPAPQPYPSPTPTPSPTPSSGYGGSGNEYRNSLPVNYSNAEFAYEHGITGAGVTIAVIDTGIDVDNPEFEGRISEDSVSIPFYYRPCGGCSTSTVEYDLNDVQGHGTNVSSVALGARNGDSSHGVAYDATLLAIKVAGGNTSGLEEGDLPPEEGLQAFMIPSAIHYAVNHDAFVINMSLNGWASGSTAEKFRAAMDAVAENDLLMVQSVSNANEDSFAASITEDMVGSDFTNADWFLYGIRVDNRREPIPGNGQPGALAHRTLAVAADSIIVMGIDEHANRVSGNSLAAPAIAGAAALLKQNWPQLGGSAIADILLSTATDLGEPGVDQLFGAGMLNIEAAMSADSAQVGASSSSMTPLKGTALFTSGPFGGAAGGDAFNSDNAPTFAIDKWGRDFEINADRLVHGMTSGSLTVGNLVSVASKPELTPYEASLGSASYAANSDWHDPSNAPHSYGIRLSSQTVISGSRNTSIAPSYTITPSLLASAGVSTTGMTNTIAHRGGRITVGIADARNEEDQSSTLSAKLELPNGISASYAASREDGSALGMRGTGAFEIVGAKTDFVTLGWSGNLEGFDLTAEAIAARTEIQTGNDTLAFHEPVLSAGFKLAAEGPLFGGDFMVGLTSPLKVERARVVYTSAQRYDLATRSLVHGSNSFDMSSASRELDFEMGYSHDLYAGQISLNAGYSINAGNAAGQKAAAASLRFGSAL